MDRAVLTIANEDSFGRGRNIAWVEAPRRRRNAGDDATGAAESNQRASVASLDQWNAWGAVGCNPKALSASIPGNCERMDSGGQRRDRSASRATGEDLPIEDAGNPDRRSVACDALDEAVFRIDRKDRLRLDRRCCSEGQQADQRSAPAISFCSLEWIELEPATNSPRSSARSAPR